MIVGLKGIISGGVSIKDFSKVTQIDENDSNSLIIVRYSGSVGP